MIQLNPFIVEKKKAEAKKVNANSPEIYKINPKSFLTLRPKLAGCTIERALVVNLGSNLDFAIYWTYC